MIRRYLARRRARRMMRWAARQARIRARWIPEIWAPNEGMTHVISWYYDQDA